MPLLEIKVKPQSGQSILQQAEDGSWRAMLKSPPVDGKANAELIKLVAKHFGCAKSEVTIKTGASGRMKRIHIPD